MAESAKIHKRCAVQKSYVHQKIWVEKTFFDSPKTHIRPVFHLSWDKFEGTITKVIDEDTGRVEVRWDFDNALTNTNFCKLHGVLEQPKPTNYLLYNDH